MTALAALALLAMGVGVAVAQKQQGGKGQAQSKKLKRLKDLEQSSVALTAYLTGQAAVNEEGDDGAGDPGAKASATLFAKDRQTLCYAFLIRGAEAPTNVHVNRAPAGQTGDVVIDFTKGVPKDATGAPAGDPGYSSGCKTLEGTEREALTRILVKPQNYYVNVPTPSFPDGAVRGQLGRMYYDND